MNLDARPINNALCDIVSPHMKTPDDVRHELAGSTRFSEFDMNHGYNQSTLSEESSRKYGVFQTHEGFHRFTGLYFGHKQSSQAFDADVKTSLRGLKHSESVADNIRALEEIFGRHGYPNKLITDNGPPWNGLDSHEMKQYLKWAGVEHSPTRSADDPETNGLTERFMQMIGKSWATAYVEGRDPLAALNATLKSYRNTEHSVTKRKPAEWLFGRTIRTRLPQLLLQTQCEDAETEAAKDRIREKGVLEKKRHDAKTREEDIQVGTQVLLKHRKKRKGMPRYDPKPFTVVEIVGRQATLKRGNTTLHRETQKFKKYYPESQETSTAQLDDEWEEQSSRITTTGEETPPTATDVPLHHITIPDITVPNITTHTDETETEAEALPRRSNRNRNAPDRLGTWTK